MVKKGSFRPETDNYVPKLLAAAIIGKHPERYGFAGIVRQDPMEHETVTVPANVGIDVLAKCAGVTVDDFRSLNPQLRRWALPPSPARQIVHVPTKKSKKFLAALERIPPDQRITHRRHKVAKGETLAKIAGKYSVSVHSIQSVNKIRNANRISVGQTLVIPVAGQPSGQTALTSSAGGGATKRKRTTTHVVRKGETLSQIAEKYSVKTSALMRWNALRSANRIRVGQRLKLSGTRATPASTWTRYTVRRGDTLSTIARRQGCTITQLKQWNGLRSSRIVAGQKLKVKRK